MIITLDFDSLEPIYQQLYHAVVVAIAKGDLSLGESLPTVRQLANDAEVNPMTVNKTYHLLRDDGYIVIDRRHGARVADHLPVAIQDQEVLDRQLDLILARLHLAGYSLDVTQKRIASSYTLFNGGSL